MNIYLQLQKKMLPSLEWLHIYFFHNYGHNWLEKNITAIFQLSRTYGLAEQDNKS